jgi:hypothetical protein
MSLSHHHHRFNHERSLKKIDSIKQKPASTMMFKIGNNNANRFNDDCAGIMYQNENDKNERGKKNERKEL